MHGVIAQLETNIAEDEEKGGHAHREPNDIQQGKGFVPPKVAEGDTQIIFDHSRDVLAKDPAKWMPFLPVAGDQYIRIGGHMECVRF